MTYGYARVSSKDQNIERQIRNIRIEHPDAVIIQEAFSGTTQDRPAWNMLKSRLQSGDMIVFDSVSRMSRNAEEGFSEYQDFFRQGIELTFLKEPHISTSTYKQALSGQIEKTHTDVDVILEGVNAYLMILAKNQIRLAFEQAQKEVDDLHQRTREGMLTARLNGVRLGRPRGRTITEKERKAKNLMMKRASAFGGDLRDSDCMKVIGVSKGTYYRYKRELLNIKKSADSDKRLAKQA